MMKFGTRASVLATAGVMALALAACGNNSGEPTKGQANRAVAEASGSEQTQEKFQHYTKAFNDIIHDFFGPRRQYDSYVKLNIPSASPTASLNFPEGATRLQQVVDSLKQGRALNGGPQSAKADAAADKLIAASEALLAQWRDLTPYFQSQAYREDGLAKAKAAHPQLIAAYEAVFAANDEFDVALTEYLRARDKARADAYKAAGDMPAYHSVNTMQLADHFTSAVIEGDIAEADKLLPELTASLAEFEKMAAGLAEDDSNKSSMTQMASYLNRSVGAYREFKATQNESRQEQVVDSYNSAVESSNRLQFAN